MIWFTGADAVTDADAETRIYALWALGELRDPRALPVLQKAASEIGVAIGHAIN